MKMTDFENYILDVMDDNIIALENKIGFERNFAIYLLSEGKEEEAKLHLERYQQAKKELANYKRKLHRERKKWHKKKKSFR